MRVKGKRERERERESESKGRETERQRETERERERESGKDTYTLYNNTKVNCCIIVRNTCTYKVIPVTIISYIK